MSLLLLFNQPSGGGGGIVQGFHPRIEAVYDGDLFVLVGETGPIRFIFARPDGELLALPDRATITVTKPDGSTSAVTPDVEATVPALQQVLGCDYLFTARGLYSISILATLDGHIAGGRVTVVCDN